MSRPGVQTTDLLLFPYDFLGYRIPLSSCSQQSYQCHTRPIPFLSEKESPVALYFEGAMHGGGTEMERVKEGGFGRERGRGRENELRRHKGDRKVKVLGDCIGWDRAEGKWLETEAWPCPCWSGSGGGRGWEESRGHQNPRWP